PGGTRLSCFPGVWSHGVCSSALAWAPAEGGARGGPQGGPRGAGAERPLLPPAEVASLEVRRGSLHASELAEIRSHVVHTFAFLSKVPWGASFRDVPRIAGAHHERLDGSGYPAGLSSAQIPVESKIMTIADIFDALTARDRPYKKAMPVSRALD